MFKFLKQWFDEYNEITAWYASQGIHVIHTPYGVVHYIDRDTVERLNTMHDKPNAIPKKD